MNEDTVRVKAEDGSASPQTRADSRFIPLTTVSAIVLGEGGLLAHGVLSNLSESGACLVTNTVIEPGLLVEVRLSTRKGPHLVETRARVVWSEEGVDPVLEIVGAMVGVSFADAPEDQQGTVSQFLQQATFHEVSAADIISAGSPWTSTAEEASAIRAASED